MAAYESWGRYPKVEQTMVPMLDRSTPLPRLETSMLPRGNGRSYGDSCLNANGTLLGMRGLDRFIAFDPSSGLIEAEAGVLFSDILDLVTPQGWFLPVTPGTRFVTLGGAIANDVHGKNHHRAGTIAHHLRAFTLVRSDGTRLRCSLTENPNWFHATIGGLGLTGAITEATLQLRRIRSPWVTTESHKFGNLDEFFHLSRESDRDYEYTVSWIDCLASGKQLGRGLFNRGNHSPARACPDGRAPGRTLLVPFTPPISLINGASLRAFNTLYFHKQRRPVEHAVAHYRPFFYPLDGIGAWNRIYGPRGFLQYQCVVPPGTAADATAALLRAIASSGTGSFLAVLKQFGSMPSLGMLSFPREGTTLALDFPNAGPRTFALLDRLDAIVSEAGGSVYPAKDARMAGKNFKRYFPAWESFLSYVDPGFSSSFWRRVMELT